MTPNPWDSVARFFYDGARVSLTVLVIGTLARGGFSNQELLAGALFTVAFLAVGVTIELGVLMGWPK